MAAKLRSEARRGPDVLRGRAAPSVARRAPGSRRTCRATPLPVGRHGRGLRACTGSGRRSSSRRAGRSCPGRGVRRSRCDAVRVADLRGGVLPRRRAAADRAERHLPPRADARSSSAPRSRRLASCRGWRPAEELWAQGWSEPNAGSDLAGIQSRAVRDEARGGWRLTGQKTWCTRAAPSATGCSVCSAPIRGAERHRGLTYFLVPLRAPGVTVRPVAGSTATPGFAEIFLDDVFVPDRDVLGEVNDGWNVAMTTASSERGLTLRSPGRFARDRAAAGRSVPPRRATPVDPTLRDARRPGVDGRRRPTACTRYRPRRSSRAAAPSGAEASLNKVFWSELDVRMHETAMRLLGPARARADAPSGRPTARG